MSTITMPKLADSTDEYVILSIAVEPGNSVAAGDVLMTVETDKVNAEVTAEVAGTVTAILVEVDDEVTTGTPIVEIDEE